MKIKYIFIFTFCIYNLTGHSQRNESGFAVYNIGLGGVVGSIGAIINKSPEQKFGKVVLKGFYQGLLGGAFVHTSKVLAGKIGEDNSYSYAWYGKLTNSIGNSIIENASLNKNFYDQFNINFGFNRLEICTIKKLQIKYKIMPVSLLLTIYSGIGSKFELQKTFQTGEIVFSGSKFNSDNRFRATTIGNVIVINPNFVDNKYTFAHELIHIYQYYDYNFVNTFTTKPIDNLLKNSNFYKNSKKLIYYDFQAPVLRGLYLSQKVNYGDYYDNFYEREAGVYSKTLTD